MNARKSTALAIITGLAAAASLAGTAGSAFAEDTQSRTASNKAASVTGAPITNVDAKAPQAKLAVTTTKVAANRDSRASAQGVSASKAAAYRDCYVYANGSGDLCSWWNWKYGGSRGGVYFGDSDWADNYFTTYGTGQYTSMNNNALSVYNYDSYLTSKVYTGKYASGYVGTLKPKYGGDYNNTFKLNVESNGWS